MENPWILNWRGWSGVRKARVICGFAGVVVTIVMAVLSVLISPREPGDLITALLVLVCWLSWKISEAFGWKLVLYTGQHLSVVNFCILVVTNAFLRVFVGTLIGRIVRR